jgi:uncharacterized C2H2 Zn-finger protein
MSEREAQSGDTEVARCHICAQVFDTQNDLSKHLMEAHGGKEPASGSG